MLKFSQLQIYIYIYICNNKHISFKGENQINRQCNNHEFSGSTKKRTWESVYIDTDPNHMYNSFLRTFLSIFQAHFPAKYKCMKDKNDWITHGIKISCKNKRKSVCCPKNSNDP